MQLLHDTAGLTIQHDPATCWLYIMWRGVHSGPAALQCCELILAQVRLTGSVKILNDGSQDLDGWEAVVRWTAEHFFPLLADNGITAIAWVRPQNLRAQTHMQETMRATKRPLVDFFSDVESAHRWLNRC